jgi:hypothetical protein
VPAEVDSEVALRELLGRIAPGTALRDGLKLKAATDGTDPVRSQISIGLCSTQPACGRICSCSSWWRPTSLPPWSKTMKRVLVVPWSIAAAYCAIHCTSYRIVTPQPTSRRRS